jgi:hypothetical protein
MRGLMMSSAQEKVPSSPRIDGLDGILDWFFLRSFLARFWGGVLLCLFLGALVG